MHEGMLIYIGTRHRQLKVFTSPLPLLNYKDINEFGARNMCLGHGPPTWLEQQHEKEQQNKTE